tara:strand:+ start:2234 stop:2554 length:321 start_codon:yes stop_codon:yes gene_type:complete
MEAFLIKVLVEDGGMWGVVAAISFFWALYVGKISRKRQDSVIDEIQKQSKKIRELEIVNAQRLEELNQCAEERVADLKVMLEDYHKTMSDINTALDHIKFIMDNKL